MRTAALLLGCALTLAPACAAADLSINVTDSAPGPARSLEIQSTLGCAPGGSSQPAQAGVRCTSPGAVYIWTLSNNAKTPAPRYGCSFTTFERNKGTANEIWMFQYRSNDFAICNTVRSNNTTIDVNITHYPQYRVAVQTGPIRLSPVNGGRRRRRLNEFASGYCFKTPRQPRANVTCTGFGTVRFQWSTERAPVCTFMLSEYPGGSAFVSTLYGNRLNRCALQRTGPFSAIITVGS